MKRKEKHMTYRDNAREPELIEDVIEDLSGKMQLAKPMIQDATREERMLWDRTYASMMTSFPTQAGIAGEKSIAERRQRFGRK
jgi:hypothetical protein